MKIFFSAGMTAFLFISPVAATWTPTRVVIPTKDETNLVANFQKPQSGKPVVICLHGLASGKEEWTPFAKKMTDLGWEVLAYDARGHSESSLTKDAKGNPDGFQRMTGSDWPKMIDDVGLVVQYVRKSLGNNEAPLYLAGASVGANVSLIYASLTRSLRGIVLLSPGLQYVVFRTDNAIQQVHCPILMVVSSADANSFQSCQKLVQLQPQSKLWTDVKPGHGVQMFDEALLNRIGAWLEAHK